MWIFELSEQVKQRCGTLSLGQATFSLLTMQSFCLMCQLGRVWNHLSVDIELVASDEQLEGASVGMHFQIMTWLVLAASVHIR